MILTDRVIPNFKANGKLQKHADGGDLYIYTEATCDFGFVNL